MDAVSGSGSISYERIADSYDAQRGGLVRGAGFAADLAPWITSRPVLELGVGTGAIAKPLGDVLHTRSGPAWNRPTSFSATRTSSSSNIPTLRR
jgi:hypothetical protein